MADLCFTWPYSWTNCWCLSLEGLLFTPPPKPLNLTCFPWYALNSTLGKLSKISNWKKMVVYWWNSFSYLTLSEFCVVKTLICLVSLWSDYSTEWMMLEVYLLGRRQKKNPLCPLFQLSFFWCSICILGCEELRWLYTWLGSFPTAAQENVTRALIGLFSVGQFAQQLVEDC